MRPIKTPRTNKIFVAEGCIDLPATTFVSEGMIVTETCWNPSEEEFKKIRETGVIFITFTGEQIIPMIVSTKPLMEDKTNE